MLLLKWSGCRNIVRNYIVTQPDQEIRHVRLLSEFAYVCMHACLLSLCIRVYNVILSYYIFTTNIHQHAYSYLYGYIIMLLYPILLQVKIQNNTYLLLRYTAVYVHICAALQHNQVAPP